MAISGFEGKYRFLSNFVGGVENKFQAAKTDDLDVREWVLSAPTPGEAKRRGRSFRMKRVMRSDWDRKKDEIMDLLVAEKFSQEPYRSQLLATGDEELIEDNWWGDQYWGVCQGEGQNKLGKILMKIRNELRQPTT